MRGELDLSTAPLIVDVLAVAARGWSRIDLDVAGLWFCDVAGLTALEVQGRHLARQGSELRLWGTAALMPLLRLRGLFPGAEAMAGDLQPAAAMIAAPAGPGALRCR